MANKMLIDAAHPEETRVVVLRGNRVEEFDFEAANRKQLRGNIYLAKVTRVEPSLQAAFVDYGGNRHGFLAFSEIHPDYYQIPVADRQALIEAEEREIAEEDSHDSHGHGHDHSETAEAGAKDADEASEASDDRDATSEAMAESTGTEAETVSAPAEDDDETEASAGSEEDDDSEHDTDDEESPDEVEASKASDDSGDSDDGDEVVSDDQVDSVGAEDAMEEVPERRKPRMRQYKIQEVIRRRQVLLVQVVKEERGNKGAALTTYLSLAGRYSVLMPNTARGGGISRKITSPTDRKRLKQVVSDLEVPEGMGVILRTAGASRTKTEVKRDFEYLLRLWENVRELTLRSIAPTLVYEEGSLIKRSIRDLYNKDIDEIQVAGDDAYREAKDFMRMLMPSHARNVQPYREKQPLFARSGIEAQLDAMFSPQVTLRSGGYIVINQTEALVAIDVNSGRSTREHNIEDTAHQTNLEAAEEVARQLRLRDLAGLIVIDFIDMEEKRNNRAVERKLKEALKNDRARIQVGRISHFGLLEMSRQRIRTGVLESTTSVCPTCQGMGHVRAPASVALHVLRALEDQLLKGVNHHLIVHTRTPVALYILNQKRAHISELEQRFGLTITVAADETVSNGAHFVVERGEPIERHEAVSTTVQPDSVQPVVEDDEDEIIPIEAEETSDESTEDSGSENGSDGGRKRRRRRRRRGGGDRDRAEPREATVDARAEDTEPAADESSEDEDHDEQAAGAANDEGGERKRRRGRRGGRRSRRGRGGEDKAEHSEQSEADAEAGAHAANGDDREAFGEEVPSMAEPPAEVSTPEPVMAESEAPPTVPEAQTEAPAEPEPQIQPEPQPEPEAQAEPEHAQSEEEAPPPPPQQPEAEESSEPDRPKRSGWWQRRSFF